MIRSLIICSGLLAGAITAHAATLTVTNTNDDGTGSLREAISMALDNEIILFDSTLNGQTITLQSPITINRDISVQGPGADLLNIDGGGSSQLFRIRGGAEVTFTGLSFANASAGSGGAFSNEQNSQLTIEDSFFNNNFASSAGGAIDNDGSQLFILRSTFSNNITPSLGGAINNAGNGFLSIDGSTLSNNMSTGFDGGAITNLGGTLEIVNSTVTDNFAANFAGGIGNNVPSDIPLIRNTIVADNSTATGRGLEFGNLANANAIQSAGSNLIGAAQGPGDGNTVSAFSINTSDQFGTPESPLAPLLSELDDHGGTVPTREPQAGSPVIDSGFSTLQIQDNVATLPCSYKDLRGLGRPQDGDGDGVFECDIGAVEVQAGDPLTGAQSGAFFDATRNGEGSFVEILEGGEQALVATFTYTPSGDSPAWFIGLGDVVGNTIVVDDMLITEGGVFGAGFDAANINRSRVGGLSLIFPGCQATQSNGRLAFESESGTGYQDLLVQASRLSSIIDCDLPAANPSSGRSGSFFAPDRDGEGIFVQWLSDGRAIVIWYTYDLDGNQFWTISSDVTIENNTLTAEMVFPQSTTVFGSQFNPDEIDLQPWGTVTLEYQAGCNDVNFSYDSSVNGFGSGAYNYTRLSTLQDTTCDL